MLPYILVESENFKRINFTDPAGPLWTEVKESFQNIINASHMR